MQVLSLERYANRCKSYIKKNKMYEFVDRFVNIALPRVRDFRGVNTKALMVKVIMH